MHSTMNEWFLVALFGYIFSTYNAHKRHQCYFNCKIWIRFGIKLWTSILLNCIGIKVSYHYSGVLFFSVSSEICRKDTKNIEVMLLNEIAMLCCVWCMLLLKFASWPSSKYKCYVFWSRIVTTIRYSFLSRWPWKGQALTREHNTAPVRVVPVRALSRPCQQASSSNNSNSSCSWVSRATATR